MPSAFAPVGELAKIFLKHHSTSFINHPSRHLPEAAHHVRIGKNCLEPEGIAKPNHSRCNGMKKSLKKAITCFMRFIRLPLLLAGFGVATWVALPTVEFFQLALFSWFFLVSIAMAIFKVCRILNRAVFYVLERWLLWPKHWDIFMRLMTLNPAVMGFAFGATLYTAWKDGNYFATALRGASQSYGTGSIDYNAIPCDVWWAICSNRPEQLRNAILVICAVDFMAKAILLSSTSDCMKERFKEKVKQVMHEQSLLVKVADIAFSLIESPTSFEEVVLDEKKVFGRRTTFGAKNKALEFDSISSVSDLDDFVASVFHSLSSGADLVNDQNMQQSLGHGTCLLDIGALLSGKLPATDIADAVAILDENGDQYISEQELKKGFTRVFQVSYLTLKHYRQTKKI